MQTIYYSAATCGSGKTTWAINRMVNQPARYVYAVDRIDEFEARSRMIGEASDLAGVQPIVRMINSRDPSTIVRRDYPDLMDSQARHDHVILLVTHEALKIASHEFAQGWTLIVDEDPKLWVSDQLDLDASRPFWSATYDLEPLTSLPGYSSISAKASAPTIKQVSADVLTRHVSNFHNRVLAADASRIIVNLTDFDSLTDRKRMTWFSIWNVRELAHYDGVIILANAFDKLISAHLIRTLFTDVELVPIQIGERQEWTARDVQIDFIAADHRAGSTFFRTTDEGRHAVKAWEAWASGRVDPHQHYWCANNDTAIKLPGDRISAKIAGSNRYRQHHECSVLYTAKAGSNEAAVFADLTNGAITADEVMRDREYEDLIQIVFRSALRMPSDPLPVQIQVYDRDQADFLKSYFEAAGFPFRIKTSHHDIGVTRTLKASGRKPVGDKAMTAAERTRKSRALARAKLAIKAGAK